MMATNGGGSDSQANCILEVCCGGTDSKQIEALTEVLKKSLHFLSHGEATDVAKFIADHWDLAPKGSLYAFKQEIARLARGPAYEG